MGEYAKIQSVGMRKCKMSQEWIHRDCCSDCRCLCLDGRGGGGAAHARVCHGIVCVGWGGVMWGGVGWGGEQFTRQSTRDQDPCDNEEGTGKGVASRVCGAVVEKIVVGGEFEHINPKLIEGDAKP